MGAVKHETNSGNGDGMKTTAKTMILDAIAGLDGDCVSAARLARIIGRAESTVVKVAGRLAARGKIERLTGLWVYRACAGGTK